MEREGHGETKFQRARKIVAANLSGCETSAKCEQSPEYLGTEFGIAGDRVW